MRALIVGGGVGGLTAAIALRRAGIDATVFERAGASREGGTALTLWTNAIKALGRLGLADAIEGLSEPLVRGAFRLRRGTTLAETPLAELGRKFGAPNVVIGRARLQSVLLAALDPGVVRLGAGCVGVEQDGRGVTASLADGRTECGDLLIGADGLNSTVRAQLFGAERPRYAGYTAYRAVVPCGHDRQERGHGFESWGRGVRFGLVHSGPAEVYWFAAITAPEGRGDGPAGRKGDLLSRFRGWHAPVEATIERTDEGAILHNDIYDRPPLRRWSVGRITLLGDAAHPMTPSLGQGACQAIEDAVVLAECLRAGGASGVVAALGRYEERRRSRTAAITRQSRRIGSVAQWTNPAACALRDALLRIAPPGAMLKALEPLVGYEV